MRVDVHWNVCKWFATSRESLKFSWDASVPIPRPKELPFGFHGKETAKVVEGGAAWRS